MLARCLASLLTFSCLALKSSSACCCTRKYASEFCKDFSVLRLLAAAQLTDAFQLVAETEEAEVIQAASSKSLCQRYWPVTRTLHQRRTVGFSHCLQDRFYHLSWGLTGLSHYLEPYLHYFLYHCIVGCSSPIFCLHTTRETSRHITCLACSIRNSFW